MTTTTIIEIRSHIRQYGPQAVCIRDDSGVAQGWWDLTLRDDDRWDVHHHRQGENGIPDAEELTDAELAAKIEDRVVQMSSDGSTHTDYILQRTMLHEISGHNFHGRYSLRLRGPVEGFTLSEGQARRYWHELCPFADCTCGGGHGEGPDHDSATVEQDFGRDGEVILKLIPAARRIAQRAK